MNLEICQIIYIGALKNYLQGKYDEPVPDDIHMDHLKSLLKELGPEVLIRHPAEIEWIFRDMDVKLYQEVQALYCSKFLRKPAIVTEIINRQRHNGFQGPIDYLVIWIACTYMSQLKEQASESQVVFEKTGWFVGHAGIDIRVYSNDSPSAASLIGVVDEYDGSLVAFRVSARRNLSVGMRLALYDALIHCRRPNPGSPDGLVWKLPSKVALQKPGDSLCLRILAHLGIQSKTTETQELNSFIDTGWSKDLAGRKLSSHQIEKSFGTYLNNLHQGNPRKRLQNQDREYRSSIGYKSDPAVTLPILRELLPLYPTKVNGNGEVLIGSAFYAGDLLKLWSGEEAQICLSEKSQKVAWIYSKDGCFLCEVYARRPGIVQGNNAC